MNDTIIIEQLTKYFKQILEEIMQKEREKYLQENTQTRANGYYTRRPKTILGEIELEIPRTRDGNFKTEIIPERKRVTYLLDDIVEALFKAGLSSRKISDVMKNLIGSKLSATYISNIADISQEVIENNEKRKLEEEYPVIYIDATYISLKRDTVTKEAVYVVLGLRKDGKREILTYQMPGGDEKAAVWGEILNNLKQRGLKGVKMIISDDLTGLDKVIKEEFPEADHQLCWFHLKKNIKNKVRRKDFEKILKELEYVFESSTEEEAKRRLILFVEKWSKLYKYFKNITEKIENYTHCFKYNEKIRSYFRTTNWLERCFKELKDNIRIRGYFQTETSANKFLYYFFEQKNIKYIERKLRYSNLIEEVFNEKN